MSQGTSESVHEATVSRICHRMQRRLGIGNGDAALRGIAQFVIDVLGRQSSVARVFSSRELDATCLSFGRQLREVPPLDETTVRSDCIVFLATHLSPSGGHSRVLADLIEAERASEVKILVSNFLDTFAAADVASLYGAPNISLEVASDPDFAQRVRWLQRRLSEIKPRKTYMLVHHFDSMLIAAVQPDLVGQLVYYHNCDHSLALGVHLPHALHVDPHAKGFYNCREREGVRGNVMWPLTARDEGHRVDRPFLARGHLTTCSSGGFEKFEFSHFREKVPYIYRYEEIVPHILKASGGTHIHIGKLSDRMLSIIAQGMEKLGIAPDRFIHMGYVPSLWKAFLDHEIDVYVGSFPLGGGRATIEAMGAGMPLVIHANYRTAFFTDMGEVYSGAVIWERPRTLLAALRQFDVESLKRHSARARAFYERNHGNNVLRNAMDSTARGLFIEPQRPVFYGNSLQSYMDEHRASFEHWFRRKPKEPKPALARFIRHAKSLLGLRKEPPAKPAWLIDAEEFYTLDRIYAPDGAPSGSLAPPEQAAVTPPTGDGNAADDNDQRPPSGQFLEFCNLLSSLVSDRKYDAALRGISQFVHGVIARQSSVARVFSARELDLACLAIGRQLRAETPPIPSQERSDAVVFMVTHLSVTGGHSRVLSDFIEAEQAKEIWILVSNLHDEVAVDEVMDLYRSQGAALQVATAPDLADRVRWLQERLAEIRPRRTYMLLHHFDPVSVAAVQPGLVNELIYFHNCDHSLALGIHIPHALHVDPHAKGFYNCRDREGVRGNVVWPMAIHDQGHRVDRRFCVRGHLTTLTSGGFEKFEFNHYREQVSYAYRYEELVPHILKASGGTHIHVGVLSERMLAVITQGMEALGVAPDRFIHVGFVPSLWQALLDLEVDVYLGSFPLGGGRASVEAMGAGMPLIIHSNYRSSLLSVEFDVYPDTMMWRTQEELLAYLSGLTELKLIEHARKSRDHYLKHHHPSVLRALLRDPGNFQPPARPNYQPAHLEAYLDEHTEIVPEVTRKFLGGIAQRK